MTPHPHPRARCRATAVVLAGAALVVATAGAASAHVRVTPSSSTAGAFSVLTFRVPTESETASTTALTVDLPTATPFTSVSVQQLSGWTSHVETGALPAPVDVGGATITTAPLHVTWTADPGSAVAPGQFQQLAISVGPLPQAGTTVVLPAHQTYSDGSVVDWTGEAKPGQPEPEHPAPELTTTGATDATDAADAAGPTVTSSPAPSTDRATASDPASPADPVARWLGAAGLVLGVVAVVVAITSRNRRSTQ